MERILVNSDDKIAKAVVKLPMVYWFKTMFEMNPEISVDDLTTCITRMIKQIPEGQKLSIVALCGLQIAFTAIYQLEKDNNSPHAKHLEEAERISNALFTALGLNED